MFFLFLNSWSPENVRCDPFGVCVTIFVKPSRKVGRPVWSTGLPELPESLDGPVQPRSSNSLFHWDSGDGSVFRESADPHGVSRVGADDVAQEAQATSAPQFAEPEHAPPRSRAQSNIESACCFFEEPFVCFCSVNVCTFYF